MYLASKGLASIHLSCTLSDTRFSGREESVPSSSAASSETGSGVYGATAGSSTASGSLSIREVKDDDRGKRKK